MSSEIYTALQNTVSGSAIAHKIGDNQEYAKRFYRSLTNTWVTVGTVDGDFSFGEVCEMVAWWMGVSYEEAHALFEDLGGVGDIDNEVKYDLAQIGVILSRAY